MADRVCVMRDGRIEQVAAPADLYSHPATPFVAEFVGTMNRIPGHITGRGVDVLGRILPFTGTETHAPGTTVDVLVRPEGLGLEAAPDGRGIVVTKTFLGSTTRVSVLLGHVTVHVDRGSAEASALEPGAAVEVSITAQEVMVAAPNSIAAAAEATPDASVLSP